MAKVAKVTMDKIYMDAKDKNVAKVVIYYNSSNGSSNAPFLDEECTIPFPNDKLYDAFLKGAILRNVNDSFGHDALVVGCHFDSKGLAYVWGHDRNGTSINVPKTIE